MGLVCLLDEQLQFVGIVGVEVVGSGGREHEATRLHFGGVDSDQPGLDWTCWIGRVAVDVYRATMGMPIAPAVVN